MLGKAIQPEIAEMISAKDYNTLRDTLLELDVADVAEILADLEPDTRAVAFRLLPRNFAAEVFENLPFEDQEELLGGLSPDVLGYILNSMSPDDRTHLLEELPGSVTQRLLRTLNPDELKVTRTLLGYPEDSVGRLMTPEYIAADPDWTVGETFEFIRHTGAEAETLSYIYVVDRRGRLVDDVYLGKLVMADLATPLRELVQENYVSLSPYEDREEAVATFKKYDLWAIPVVDSAGVMLGIVTADDVMDVEEEEVNEDIALFSGQAALEESYMATPKLKLAQKRAGWLTILFVGGFASALALEQFQGLLQEFVILSAFIPLVISSGGNSGSQSASLVIRSLAIQEVELRDWRRIFIRELAVGLGLGLFLGVIFSLIVVFRDLLGFGAAEEAIRLSIVALFSVLMVVTLGTLTGALLPLLLKRMGFDPAVSSAPFIATFMDISGIVLYLTLAGLILRM